MSAPDESRAASLLLEGDGLIRMASSGACEMLGRTARQLEGLPLHEVLESPGRAVVEAMLLDLHAPARLAVRVRVPAGDPAEADLWLRPLPQETGGPGPVMATFHALAVGGAISANPGAASAARGRVAAREGVEAVSDAVLVCRDAAILEASDGIAELAGVAPSRLAGWSIKSLVAAEDLLPVVEILRRVQSGDPA